MASRAVFVDRDGVLIKDKNLLTSLDDAELYPLVADAVVIFRELGFKVFVITNQAIVARGLLSLAETTKLNDEILELIQAKNPNAIFDGVYLCPHHPKATLDEFRRDCNCRKPKSGMILKAKEAFGIDLSRSIVIGDRVSDIYAGKSVGCRGFLLQTGQHEAPLIETTFELDPKYTVPDLSFNSLYEAALYLKDQNEN